MWSDPYDDLNPVFSADGNTIWFASNRPGVNLKREFVLGEPTIPTTTCSLCSGRRTCPNSSIGWKHRNGRALPQVQSDEYVTFPLNWKMVHKNGGPLGGIAVAYIDTTIHYRWFTQQRLAATLDQPVSHFQYIPARNCAGFAHRVAGHPFPVETSENKEDCKTSSPVCNWREGIGCSARLGLDSGTD